MTYDLSRVRILIVEDMPPMLRLTISLLGMFGFKNIDGAKTVEDGLKLFRQHSHDLIITDWLMEPLDGLDLIRSVRHDAASPNKYVPIILMTGYSDQPSVETARDVGVTEFLMKPFSARDMYARIVQVIEKPRQFVDTGEFFGPDRRRRKNFDFNGDDRRGLADAQANWPGGDDDFDLELRDLREDTTRTVS